MQASAQKQKDEAMEEFRRHSYEKAVKLFQLCLLLHPEDGSGVKFRRSVQSHQATAYFKLKNYRKALEVGEKSYNSNPTFKSKVRVFLLVKLPPSLPPSLPRVIDVYLACILIVLFLFSFHFTYYFSFGDTSRNATLKSELK